MKIYKIPVQIFEKDLEARTKRFLAKSKFRIKFKFFLFFFAAILTVGGIYFYDQYDFVPWDRYSQEEFEKDAEHKKSLIEGDNGYTKEDYEKDVKELRADIGEKYEHPIWSSIVEFIITAVLVIALWMFILGYTDNMEFYSYQKLNEKVVSKKPMEILFLKLDFLSKGKKGEDVTGSIYVSSPDSKNIEGEHTLLIQNKQFQTREIVSKDADEIKDIDDYFDLDNLENIEKIISSDNSYQRVSSGENEMNVYKNVISKMNSKYGIKILNIDYLILPIWEIEIKNNYSVKRKIQIDQYWGNKIEFANFT